MTREFLPSRWIAQPAAGAVVVAATYIYFLIFAEFSFLALARPHLVTSRDVQQLMAVLGLAGVVGSFAAAALAGKYAETVKLGGGLIACAVCGFIALGIERKVSFILNAASIGLALGWTTVTLASNLKAILGRWLGGWIGVGTGSAYAFCNLPWVFTASPAVQTVLACLFAAIAAAVVLRWKVAYGAARVSIESDYRPVWQFGWIVVLLALVWLDSAAFFIIQNNPLLKSRTWIGMGALGTNAGMHLVVALLAGWALDRGWRTSLVLLAYLLLAGACTLLHRDSPPDSARLFYAAGVSVYSVVLVYYPALGSRPWLVAFVYAISGWAGSALGIGMAQELHQVPSWFIVASGMIILVALAARRWHKARLIAAAGGLAILMCRTDLRGQDFDQRVRQGHAVYLSEGCIHCHSQYIRPDTIDVEWWGPSRPLADALQASPPLFGNRRQGPDLTNVGNRRSSEWERLHLVDPDAVTPGTRMPSYAPLFRNGNPAGEALIAYLDSLGTDTRLERAASIKNWRPAPLALAVDPSLGRVLFAQLCAQCHGPSGTGNGLLSKKLAPPPADLVAGHWHYLAAFDPDETLALGRVIKFGIAGTSMPGHEWLSDAKVMALAHWVLSQRK